LPFNAGPYPTPSPKERGQNSLWKRVSKDLRYFIRTIMIENNIISTFK
jgi:hypothetical protein